MSTFLCVHRVTSVEASEPWWKRHLSWAIFGSIATVILGVPGAIVAVREIQDWRSSDPVPTAPTSTASGIGPTHTASPSPTNFVGRANLLTTFPAHNGSTART